MTLIRRGDLKPFQEQAASALAEMIQAYPSDRFRPRFDPDTGECLPFLCRLRAITGAGKTPILALNAQHLKTGIILWTTNRGAVISQTSANLRTGGKYSELLPPGAQVFQLGEMTPSDWEQTLEASSGLTIILSTVAAFNQDNDNLRIHKKIGAHTRWESLGGEGPLGRRRSLYVFYDEGHGVTERQFRKLRELKPKAFVLASASPLPEDLADLLAGKTQEQRQVALAERTVAVSTREVVLAGLLKNRLYFVDCDTAKVDAIKAANDKLTDLTKVFPPGRKIPIGCFIVNQTTRGVDIWEELIKLGVSPSKIAVHLNGARDVIQDRHGALMGMIDTYSGRKPEERSPEALAEAGFTHIIWNLTLREGWDEPMAYVAYIDDRGRSASDMVQKIGRFVRQADAKLFDDPDLNAAYFYFNVPDEAFTRLIADIQKEMETDGYEIVPMAEGRSPPTSQTTPVLSDQPLPAIAPWFGDKIQILDDVLLQNVPLFADKALKAEGRMQTRVFEMRELEEDVAERREVKSAENEAVTPWEYLSARLAAMDSRIMNESGSIFSAQLKMHERMVQPMQYGSEAMAMLHGALPTIRRGLNDNFHLRGLGRHGIQPLAPFKLVSPNVEAANTTLREKYKVRRFNNSVHAEYNGFNAFELQVAQALDALGKPWARNPVGKDGFRIPIQEIGAETAWFYPDFLLWISESELVAVEPKGRHLLEGAVGHKLLDLSSVKNLAPSVEVVFVLQGNYSVGPNGDFTKGGSTDGFTLIRRLGSKIKAVGMPSATAAVETLVS
ncbi:hypothetical protein [Brevundimonas sp.]|uniref:hypothetical protein n=1 Tax=Brevundimonas sp. TaxID=1871086 RepID=UPI0028AACE16|nr:hypothetical protein [Brevundimonas sp.]